MVKYHLPALMGKMTEAELAQMDKLLMDVGNTGSSPKSSSRLSEWMSQTARNHNIEGNVTPRRRRSLSL
jgi:hypothetical protein